MYNDGRAIKNKIKTNEGSCVVGVFCQQWECFKLLTFLVVRRKGQLIFREQIIKTKQYGDELTRQSFCQMKFDGSTDWSSVRRDREILFNTSDCLFPLIP